VDALRQASLGALPESTQLAGCVEGQELLTLFLTWSWHLSWSLSYQTQQRWPQHEPWPLGLLWTVVRKMTSTCAEHAEVVFQMPFVLVCG